MMKYMNIASKLVKIGVAYFPKDNYICYVLKDKFTKQINQMKYPRGNFHTNRK